MADAGDADSGKAALRRVVADGIGTEAADALAEGMSGSDLTTLLLDVMSRRAARRSTGDIVRQYEADRFTRPAQVDPRALLSMSLDAVDALAPDFEFIEAAPLVPLGTHSVIAGISQNRVVSTIRSTEVAADPTSSLALEAAVRRRALSRTNPKSAEFVQLASIDRVVRAQRFDGPRSFAHFTLLGLVTAGRDLGSRRFEAEAVSTHLQALTAVCRSTGCTELLAHFTDFDGDNAAVIDACAAALGDDVAIELWPERSAGIGYYESLCFKLSVRTNGETIEVADGGSVNWTQSLLGNRKERLVISGLSLERLAQLAPQP